MKLTTSELIQILLNCAEHNCGVCPMRAKGQTCVDRLVLLAAQRLKELSEDEK